MTKVSCCGLFCEACSYYQKVCTGCKQSQGSPFHMAGESKCPIYICALKKGFETCGSCHELVCKIWRETRDPRYDDEAFEKDIQERIRNLNHMHQ